MALSDGPASTVIRGVRLPRHDGAGGPGGPAPDAYGAGGADAPAAADTWDVTVRDGLIDRIVPSAQTPAPPGGAVLDADGRFLLPGLWDEHTHMVQWALAMTRLDLSRAGSAAQVLDLVAAALPADRTPVVGYGFRDAPWPDEPTRLALDQVAGAVPVVLVSADLHCAWVNGAGAELLGVSTGTDGLVREGPWFAAMARLDEVTITGAETALRRALPLLAARGVVGVVDLEWADNITDWRERLQHGPAPVRVEAGIYPDRLPQALAEGWRSGQEVPGTGGMLRVGPLKILSDGSLNTRTALCREPYRSTTDAPRVPGGGYGHREYEVAEMVDTVRRAHAGGILTTIHAIGDLAVTAALDVFEATGVPGRIEHAQLVHPDDHARFARLGVVASVQPEHAMDDRDLAEQYWPDRTGWCFPLAALHRAGATIRFGSDAPVAPLDPWSAISAAVTRSRDGRPPWHPEQALGVGAALAASTRGRTHLTAGHPADLVLTEVDPCTADGADLRAMPVWATMVAGRWTHGPG